MIPVPRWSRRRALALAVAAVAVSAAAALPWWLAPGHETRAARLAAYDLDHAMELAGAEVPEHTESFYFFVLDGEAVAEIPELAALLARAAAEREFLGVTGADAEHNRDVLLSALAENRKLRRSLSGLVLIYVGPPEHQALIAPPVDQSGAELRFVRYQPELDGAI